MRIKLKEGGRGGGAISERDTLRVTKQMCSSERPTNFIRSHLSNCGDAEEAGEGSGFGRRGGVGVGVKMERRLDVEEGDRGSVIF